MATILNSNMADIESRWCKRSNLVPGPWKCRGRPWNFFSILLSFQDIAKSLTKMAAILNSNMADIKCSWKLSNWVPWPWKCRGRPWNFFSILLSFQDIAKSLIKMAAILNSNMADIEFPWKLSNWVPWPWKYGGRPWNFFPIWLSFEDIAKVQPKWRPSWIPIWPTSNFHGNYLIGFPDHGNGGVDLEISFLSGLVLKL